MKQLVWIILSAPLFLVSCGHISLEDETPEVLPPEQRQVPIVSYTAEEAAQEFALAGASVKHLEQIKQDLLLTAKNTQSESGKPDSESKLSIQSVQNILNEVDVLVNAIEIAKKQPHIYNIDGQAYSRALLIQATRNIALNSLENFEDHANQRTYGPPLTYQHDECSTPFGSFPASRQTFKRACIQHDFGYRNGAFWREIHTGAFKGAVDAVFNSNMIQLCRKKWGTGKDYFVCTLTASSFYNTLKLVPVCPHSGNQFWCWAHNFKDGDPIE